MNLFTSPLDNLAFRDLESFLGLALPEEQRLKESERIDYKENLPQDLGDWVTALANVNGGLIFIGIKSDKKKQNVPVAWAGVPSTADLETQIVAKIVSSVRPRPDLKIGSVPLDNGSVVVVIRVSDGTYPPYEYQQGSVTKITLRVHDARKSANVRDLEALFKKRGDATGVSEQTLFNYLNEADFYCTNANNNGATEFHRIVVVPRKNARIRLDSALEKELTRKILKYFRNERTVFFSDRRGRYVQLQSKNTSVPQWHRLWRLYDSGAVAFIGTLNGEFENGKPIGDLAHNLLSMCRLAREIFSENEVYSGVSLGQLIHGTNLSLLPQFPEDLPLGKYYTTGAISVPQSIQRQPGEAFSFSELDLSELDAPYEQIAEILMTNLRELRGIVVDYKGFLSSIQRMQT